MSQGRSVDYARLAAALESVGLSAFGGFHPTTEDGVPTLNDGRPVGTLVMVGNVGPDMWRHFASAPEFADGPDPLNRWSARVLGEVAEAVRATVWFPFSGPPYLPFVAWAKRAAPVVESPLGILIHPDYGLWHAYRGALGFAERLALPPADRRPRPCDACAAQPCLGACPVAAFDGRRYRVAECAAHVSGPQGGDCLNLGCRARRACPVGREYHYATAQARFHMDSFLRARHRDDVDKGAA